MRHFLALMLVVLCSAVSIDAQDLQAIRIDYVRVRSGETHETGSFLFAADGVSRHDRELLGVGAWSTIRIPSNEILIEINHASNSAVIMPPDGLAGIGGGAERIPNTGRTTAENMNRLGTISELYSIGPKNIGPITLQGFRGTVQEQDVEIWVFQHTDGRMHFLEQTFRYPLSDGTVLIDSTVIVDVIQTAVPESVFQVPSGAADFRRPRQRR